MLVVHDTGIGGGGLVVLVLVLVRFLFLVLVLLVLLVVVVVLLLLLVLVLVRVLVISLLLLLLLVVVVAAADVVVVVMVVVAVVVVPVEGAGRFIVYFLLVSIRPEGPPTRARALSAMCFSAPGAFTACTVGLVRLVHGRQPAPRPLCILADAAELSWVFGPAAASA